MRNDFAAFILTHGRSDRVYTVSALRSHGYTGEIYFVVDDEDKTANQYIEKYGDKVLIFSKSEISKTFDEGDNFNDRRSIFYARNACFDLARKIGVRFFVELDDDYTKFYYRFDGNGFYGNWKLEPLDWLFSKLCDFLAATPFAAVALSQGGDHIGGGDTSKSIKAKRKAMNSFVCDTEKPFEFVGRINEDVNTYTSQQRRGIAFLTFMQAQLNQKATQSNAGGMTDLYLDTGTYLKSFYSVMYGPSCVKVGTLRDPRSAGGARIHHAIDWDKCAPQIIHEAHRKTKVV
jgi:hypothetical protein